MNSVLRDVDLSLVHELDEEEGVLEGRVLQAHHELQMVEVARVCIGIGGEGEEQVLEVGRARREHHL